MSTTLDSIDPPKQEKKSFTSSVKFNRGFWENLSAYEKRKRKDIVRNEYLTAYIKQNLLNSLASDLAQEIQEYKRAREAHLNQLSTEQADLVKQQPSQIISRSDIQASQKLEGIYFNENRPSKDRFYIITDLSLDKHEVLTLVPNMPLIEWEDIRNKAAQREAQLEYPLGEALDPSYHVMTPSLKKVSGKLNPFLSIDIKRFSVINKRDEFGLPVELTPQELNTSFQKNALFLTGAFSKLADLKDTLFRKRTFSARNNTLHETWDKNPNKYFMFSSQAYFERQ